MAYARRTKNGNIYQWSHAFQTKNRNFSSFRQQYTKDMGVNRGIGFIRQTIGVIGEPCEWGFEPPGSIKIDNYKISREK